MKKRWGIDDALQVTLLITSGLNISLLLYNILRIIQDGGCWRIPLIVLNAVAAIVPLIEFIQIKRREKRAKKNGGRNPQKPRKTLWRSRLHRNQEAA